MNDRLTRLLLLLLQTDQISCSHALACYSAGDHASNASAWAAGSQALLAAMAAKMGAAAMADGTATTQQPALISESNDQVQWVSMD